MFSVPNIMLLATHLGDKYVAERVDLDALVKLFLGVLLEKMLLAAQSNYVGKTALKEVHDLQQVRNIDWPYVVFEYLKQACREFADNKTYLTGCLPVLMVVFVDCIEGNYLHLQQPSRIYLYNDEVLKQHLMEHPTVEDDGNNKRKPKVRRKRGPKVAKPLEKFLFMRW